MKNLFIILTVSIVFSCSSFAVENWNALTNKANTEFKNNNCKEAFYLYKKILLEYKASPDMYLNAVKCLKKASLVNEFDSFFAAVAEKYRQIPEMAIALACSKMQVDAYGYIIAGEFVRGNRRGSGARVSSLERDRVEALNLLAGALPLSSGELLSRVIMWGRQYDRAWKLQYLTDLNKLPGYEKKYYLRMRTLGAPVDADGKAVFYHVPAGFKEARNDGERWRWSLQGKWYAKLRIANFFKSQFGVQTLAFNIRSKIQSIKTGPYALHLLKDNETIANLAVGAQKITLPDDCNYIKMYQELGSRKLVDIYKNRRQYVKAAKVLKKLIKNSKPKPINYIEELKQITANWVELLSCKTFPAGIKPELNLKFRNTREISCVLTKVKIEIFLSDIKKYLKDSKSRKEMFRLGYQPNQVANWLLKKQGKRYLGEEVAAWDKSLKPLAGHFDKTIQLQLPVDEAGVYFLEVTAKDGNSTRILVWLSSLAIIERDANGGKLFIVTDALTGKPVDYCRLSFFGYTSKYIRNKKMRKTRRGRYTFSFSEFFTQTGSNGTIFVDGGQLRKMGQVMVEANVDDRFGVLGFSGMYWRRYNPQEMKLRPKVYAITDRPIYKPGQTVNFNYWLRLVDYGRDNFVGEFAGKKVKLIVRSSRKKLFEKLFTLDNFGALDSSFKLPEDADLGEYSISLDKLGGYLRFRVEEYRKPEYEVKVMMPKKALMLGDKISITIKADYLFGAPVVNAKVKYKVYRTAKSSLYIPFYKWDWLYGRNACSFSYIYRRIGWRRPSPTELVGSNFGTTNAKGELSFTIDTALAKSLFSDTDSEYKVTAEVTDQSRYTETGQGTLIVASKAFKVYCATNKGFYQTGEVIEFSVSAISSNNKKISCKYEIDLFKITYDAKKSPVETKVKSWNSAKIKFRLNKVGHYLAKVKVTDTQNNSISSDLIIRIIGKGVASADKMTLLPLELIMDKKTYKPGDIASIMINTAESNQNVYLFVRPAASGKLNAPQVIYLPTGSAIKELRIRREDMPNIFIEALTVRNGRVYSVTKQIIVPPEKKILNIELTSTKNKYKPGQNCLLKIRITDSNGKPVAGDVVLTVYDKALDILSGGSNVPEINSFFWKWTRNWYIRSRSSLNVIFRTVFKLKETSMRPLGIFGNLHAPNAAFSGARKGIALMSKSMDTVAEVASATPETGSIVVRKNFADSVLWKVRLKTNSKGIAELPIPLPDNLTTWKIRAWAMTDKCSVGQGESEVIVSKDYLVRLILPRFLVSGDTATLSAIVMNLGKQSGKAATSIEISGDSLRLLNNAEQTVQLGANREKRLEWQVQALKAGKVAITVKSFCGENSDALELQLPIEIKGISKQTATSAYLKTGQESSSVIIDIPAKRREAATKLTINFSPSIAVAMVDALPYLIDSKDKDIFSALNRFIPALIAQNTLKKLGVNLAEIAKSKTNLNPVELGDKKTRAAQWKGLECNPVFSEERLGKIVARGLTTIAGMQNSDGGWGWFSGFYESSYLYTTVRTVGALLRVENVNKSMLSRGVTWLKAWQKRRIEKIKANKLQITNADALVFDTLVKAGVKSDFMLENLFSERSKLSLNGLTLLATACYALKDEAKLKMLLRNIEQFVVEDKENQTAYLRLGTNYWWCWYGRDIDTQAAYLKLLAKVEPRGKRAAWLAKYILINRKHATYWNSVVDTGLCVEALCDFMQNSGEASPEMNIEVLFDGKVIREVKVNAKNMFNIDNSIKFSGKKLTSGKHKIEIRRQGRGAVYFNTYLSYFTLEDSIKAAGLDLKIKRQYFKLVPIESQASVRGSRGQALEQNVEKYKRVAIKNCGKILSGDLLEIEFTIESKNDYSYIVINDGKVAGFEPVSVLSGYTQNNLWAFVEMRNTFVRFYVRSIVRGKHSMSYRMRAVTPGKFIALPVVATGVYAPELRCNSNEFRVNIK